MGIGARETRNGFALEITGVSLWECLPQHTVNAIESYWADRGVLVFRRQALAEAELCAFSSNFGALERVVRTDWASPVVPDVGVISNLRNSAGQSIGGLGDGELQWHSDQSYVAQPATGCLLYAVEIPAVGGDTLWANLERAYQALPPRLRSRIEGCKGIFSYGKRLAGYGAEDRTITAEMRAKTPDVIHDLVQRHPVTGRSSIYFDPTTTVGILGMPAEEGQAVLNELTEFCTQPQFVYRHRWQVGDVVMWDNGILLHRRDQFDPNQRRLMKRTTLALSRQTHIVPLGRLGDVPADRVATDRA
jgi:taurine dioxygenase